MAPNVSRKVLRLRGGEEEMADEADPAGPERLDPERLASEAQVSRRVQGALMTLKIDDRAGLTLRHFSECSYPEIAPILDLGEKTVKSRLFQATQRLPGLLKDLMPA